MSVEPPEPSRFPFDDPAEEAEPTRHVPESDPPPADEQVDGGAPPGYATEVVNVDDDDS